MEVSRSNLSNQTHAAENPKTTRYSKSDDAWILPMIQKITDARPTYGYRRVTQLLSFELKK
jgi:putative transposase